MVNKDFSKQIDSVESSVSHVYYSFACVQFSLKDYIMSVFCLYSSCRLINELSVDCFSSDVDRKTVIVPENLRDVFC